MDPLNYALNVQDPFAAVMNGFNNGQNRLALQQDMQQSAQNNALGLRQGEQGLLAGQQAMDLNAAQEQRAQTEFGQGQQDRASAMAAQEAAGQQAQAMQADLVALAGKVQDGTATQQDFAAMALRYPEMATELSTSMDAYEPERKRAEVFDVSRVAAALHAKNPALAISIAQERADAARNAGLAQDAAMWQGAADTIKASPEAGLTMAGMMLQGLDQDAFKSVFPEGRAVQSTQPYDNGTTVTVFTDGSKEVTDAAGQVLSGPKANEAITAALASEAEARRANAAGATAGRLGETIVSGDEANAALARGTALGKDQADAVTNLGGAVEAARQTEDLINQVLTDPALPSLLGNYQGRMPAGIPLLTGGQSGANLEPKLTQLQGRTFLAAFDSLRGAGAITEQEGKAATEAQARLARTQDPETYKASLTELLAIIKRGLARAEGKASDVGDIGRVAAPPLAATPLVNTFTFNPATGDFE